jgi:cyclic beta-1,2-glucan synthetase
LGFGNKALEYYRMINPIEHSRTKEETKKYKVEPYIIPADIYGAGNLSGRGGWTWYTGSSSWYYKTGVEDILGLKIEKKTLKISPCIPKEWREYSLKYRYGTSIYNIKVINPNNKEQGVEKFILNGELIKEKELKLEDNGGVYNIEIEM